jgi:hypothetical protein
MRVGAAAGLVALVILTTSSFFLYSVAIGQETGYTALSYAGQLGFAYAATRRPRAGMVVIAGLFAGLGALAREYGPVLSLCGFVVLACERQTWKYLPLFVLVAAVCGAPWYVRNWVLTGNPVYSTNIGLGFAVNPVHAGELALYRERFGIHTLSAAAWLGVVWRAISGAPLVWLIGLPGVVAVGRKTPAIGISVLVVLFVWLLSINYTAGGVEYSMRVLTPAYVALATAGGYFGGALLQPTGKRKKLVVAIAYLLIVLCGGYAILGCWSHPYPAHLIRETIATTRDGPMDDANPVAVFAKQFEALGFSPARVLTDDAVLAVALRRYTHSQPVMIYSPEVAFVFDKRIEPAEACRRLIADGIGFVALNYLSNTNFFLAQFPFYHDAMTQGVDDSWRLVLGVPDFKWIFSLVPVSKSQSTPNLRPELPPNGLTRKGRS